MIIVPVQKLYSNKAIFVFFKLNSHGNNESRNCIKNQFFVKYGNCKNVISEKSNSYLYFPLACFMNYDAIKTIFFLLFFRKSLKSLFFLLPLLGITNVLHFVWPNPLRGTWLSFAVWSFASHFLYSFQGFFVASVYFFFDDKVRKNLK